MYDDDGAAYTHEVDEESVEGYNKEVDGYDLINTKSEKIEITGTKTLRAPEGNRTSRKYHSNPETQRRAKLG